MMVGWLVVFVVMSPVKHTRDTQSSIQQALVNVACVTPAWERVEPPPPAEATSGRGS